MGFEIVNPHTEAVVATFERMSDDAVKTAIADADAAYREWRRVPLAERAERLLKVAATLEGRRDEWAELMTREMGKPITQSRSEIEKCARACEYYAEAARDHLAPEPVASDGSRSFVSFQPIGLVLAVMPWNFPFWQVLRFAAPALTVGNGALLKHASGTFGCAAAIEDLFREAGYPENLFRTLYVDHDQVEAVIAHPAVQAVTLTGSGRAGREVASLAGRHLKKTVLELGGSDASVVLEDADLDVAADEIVKSRLINSGQSCIAAKRFIAVDAVHDAFVERVKIRMAAAVVGDPLDDETTVGPLARKDLRDGLHEQVRASVEAGARLVMGGEVPERKGWFYPPTLLLDVAPGMPAFDDEMFGPVAAVVRARDEEHALELANRSVYGLGAAVYTADADRGARLATERLEAGACFVNGLVRSDPRLPFGGIKESGYGRELSRFGIREFANIKTVWVA